MYATPIRITLQIVKMLMAMGLLMCLMPAQQHTVAPNTKAVLLVTRLHLSSTLLIRQKAAHAQGRVPVNLGYTKELFEFLIGTAKSFKLRMARRILPGGCMQQFLRVLSAVLRYVR